MVDLTPGELLIVILSGPVMLTVAFFGYNVKRLGDMWNLKFRRSRTVCAKIHTASNRVITKYVVPDARGLFRFRGGVYHFPPDSVEIEQRYNVPVADFIEIQIASEPGNLVGESVEVEGVKVPQLMVTHAKIRPHLLKLARRDTKGAIHITDEPPVTSIEVADALDSKIVADVTNASIADLQMNRIFIISLITLGVLVLGIMGLYSKLNSVSSQVNDLQHAIDALKTVSGR